MDRRAFMADTVAAMLWTAAGHAMDTKADAKAIETCVRAQSAASAPAVTRARVAVFDLSLERGTQLAHDAAHRAVPAFALDADADIGALWHAQIAPRIARRVLLIVALRPADAFVLARLAAAHDCRVIEV